MPGSSHATRDASERHRPDFYSPSPAPAALTEKNTSKKDSHSVESPRKRSRSRDAANYPAKKSNTTKSKNEALKVSNDKIEEIDEDEAEMMKLLGFRGGFASTKGEKVIGADVSAADIVVVPKYRQVMNRRRAPSMNPPVNM